MARSTTAGFDTAATSLSTKPILLFQALFDSGNIRFWNGIGDLVYDSNTYTGAGNLLKLDKIEETQKLEARGVTLTLSGVPSSIIALALTEEYQERQITIDLAFLDADDVIIPDPFRFFSGKADVMTILDGGETATVALTAENDIITLQRVNERRRTAEDQKIESSSDTFFDGVAALQNKNIVWGGNK